jgi:hypothetical protein
MDSRDTDRLATFTRELVELAATLLLTPLKLLLRRLLPASTPMDQQRWAPAPDAAGVGDVTIADAESNGAVQDTGPGPEVHVDAPWPDYDDLTVGQVVGRLDGADDATRAMVRLYEETNKNRKGVLRATE